MGLDLPSGGHLTHGFQTAKKKVSASSIFFTSKSYKNAENGQIDYDELEKSAKEFKPDILICGGSAYPQDFDYKRLREIAGDAYLMMDMAHINGFIAKGTMKNPFEYCDVVTTTTHKLLRGPRSAMIFYRKTVNKRGVPVDVKSLIDSAVFPGLQGGPHNQKIGALAVALKQALSSEYTDYIKNVYENAQVMASELKRRGYKLYSDGTACHLILICLEEIGGSEVEKVCELANIAVNKNCISTDKSPLRPTGIRIGTPALTTRGLSASDFVFVAELIDEAIRISKEIVATAQVLPSGLVDLNDFSLKASNNSKIASLRQKVINFIENYPLPLVNYRN